MITRRSKLRSSRHDNEENEDSMESFEEHTRGPTNVTKNQDLSYRKDTIAKSNENDMSKSVKNRNDNAGSDKNMFSPEASSRNSSNNIFCHGVFVVLALFVILAVIIFKPFQNIEDNSFDNWCSINTTLDLNNDLCRDQNKMCRELKNAIMNPVKNVKVPQILVFLSRPEEREIAKCLSLLLANMSSCVLNTSGSLLLTPKGFLHKTNEIIRQFKPLIEEYRSIIFEDLLAVNVESLMALHNFCDQDNPLVTPAVYIINVISHEPFNHKDHQNCTKTVNKLMKKKFSGNMDENKVEPLVTRITDGPVFAVKFNKELKNCDELSNNVLIM